jgi:hypothetical protein
MPKIPLYNKGLGSTGVTSGGSLGPRASAGAFTGVGQQVARFGEAAGDIMFKYYDADKKAAAKTAIADAENELVKELDTHIDQDKSVDAEEFDKNYTKFSNKKIQDISGKYNLRPNEQKALIAKLGDLSAGAQLKGRQETYTRRDQIRGISVGDTLTRYKSTMASYPIGHPIHEKTRVDAINLIDESQKDGSIKYSSIRSREQLEIQVESETLNNKITGASTFSDLNKAKQDIAESTLASSEKEKFNKAWRTKRTVLANEINREIQDQVELKKPTYQELKIINEKLQRNEDVNMELANGEVISIKGSELTQDVSNSIQKFNNNKAKENEDIALNDGSSSIIDEANNTDTKTTLETADAFVKSMPDKEKAEGAVLSAALNLQADARRLLNIYEEDPSQVNANKIRQLVETSKQLLEKGYAGRPALSKQVGKMGTSSNNALIALNNIVLDLDKEIAAAQVINNAADVISSGNLSEIKENLTKPQLDQAIRTSLKGKDLDTQMLILERNNAKSEDYSNMLSEGATNILGAEPDVNKLEAQISIYQKMKARGNGVLENHLSKNEIAIYNSVLILEQSGGKSRVEAINMVAEANRTGIDVNAKYKSIKNEVDKISSETTSSFLGITFGTKPQNTAAIQQKVEDLSKIYISLGTDPKKALEQASKDIIASHINHKGVLIPRSINLNETEIKESADLIIKNYQSKNPDDDEAVITATPVTDRADKWIIIRDGIPFPNEFYTRDEILKLKDDEAKAKAKEKMLKSLEKREKLQESLKKSKGEQRREKIMQKNEKELAEFFKTDFSKALPEKTEASVKREKEKEKIRKENIKALKQTLLGPKGRELLD